MGTSNFHKVNASKYFVCLTSSEEEVLDDEDKPTGETETVYPEVYEINEFKNYVTEKMQAAKFEFWDGGSDPNELRSYSSSVLGSLCKEKDYSGVGCEVIITAVMRSAYYDGATLDWVITKNVGGDTAWEDGDGDIDHQWVADQLEYHSDMNSGMCKLQAYNIVKWMGKIEAELIEELEKIFTEVTTPYVCSARFSNGEAWYQKVVSQEQLTETA